MKKTPFRIAQLSKARILWKNTFAELYQYFFYKAEELRPVDLPDDVRAMFGGVKLKRALPRLKGGVYHTMKEIMVLFCDAWTAAPREINLAIRTNRVALTKRIGNTDPKTAYLHVLTLLEHGFLRAKVRLRGGLQLFLNPALVVFDKATNSAPMLNVGHAGGYVENYGPTHAAAEALAGAELTAHITQLAESLRLKFSPGQTGRT